MSPAARRWMFLIGALGIALMFAWAFAGLPAFGVYRGPYGDIIMDVALRQRHVWNAVAAVTFDYRGFDTLGEEFILFTAAVGLALLLRARRDEEEESPEDRALDRHPPDTSDPVRVVGLLLVAPSVLFGLYVVAHGHLSPGGGFQGGVVLATALLLVYLTGQFVRFESLSPTALVESAEATGAAAYALMGVGGLIVVGVFLQNFLPLGKAGDLFSAGMIPVINAAVGLEVSASFILILDEFLDQAITVRKRRA